MFDLVKPSTWQGKSDLVAQWNAVRIFAAAKRLESSTEQVSRHPIDWVHANYPKPFWIEEWGNK
jgi:hypothetical protein